MSDKRPFLIRLMDGAAYVGAGLLVGAQWSWGSGSPTAVVVAVDLVAVGLVALSVERAAVYRGQRDHLRDAVRQLPVSIEHDLESWACRARDAVFADLSPEERPRPWRPDMCPGCEVIRQVGTAGGGDRG